MFPQKRPFHGIGNTAQTNLHIEATERVRSQRAPGVTETTSGTIRNQSNLRIRAVTDRFHFKVEQSDHDKVKIHGGVQYRQAGGVAYCLPLLRDAIPTDFGGWYADTTELTVTADSQAVCVDLDDGLHPTTLTAVISNDLPDAHAKRIRIARITSTLASGVRYITNIEMLRTGDISDFHMEPDGNSMDYNADHKLQHKGFATEAATDIVEATDAFEARDTGPGGNLRYRSWSSMRSAAISYFISLGFPSGWLTALLTSVGTWLQTAPYTHSHGQHSAYNTDDHNVASTVPLMLLNSSGDATRNACHANVRLGAADNSPSIGPATRTVYGPNSQAIADWATNNQLNVSTDGLLQIVSNINQWSAAILKAAPTGAVTITPGASSSINPSANNTLDLALGNGIGNRWRCVDIAAGTDASIRALSTINLLGGGTATLNLGGAGVGAIVALAVNGTAGVDISGLTTMGIVTNGSGLSLINVEVADGSGGTKTVQVLGKVIG